MPFTVSELEAYLSEALPPAEMAAIEQALRGDAALASRLASIVARRSAGVVSIGDIWRCERLTCPTREQLGSYLLDALEPGTAGYIAFHIETIGCRYCRANLSDLESQQAEALDASETRRRKYFQSSVGRLRRDE